MVTISWFHRMMTVQSILKLVPNAGMQGLFMTLLWKVDKTKRYTIKELLGLYIFVLLLMSVGCLLMAVHMGNIFS